MASIRSTNIGDTLTIKKIAQFNRILTSHHPLSPYGKTTDQSKILPVGTKLTVINKYAKGSKWAPSCVTVKHNNFQFDILSSDLRKFCK